MPLAEKRIQEIESGSKFRNFSLHCILHVQILERNLINYPKNDIGDTTFEAIHSGVVNGLLFEIQHITDAFRKRYEKFNIILTGGHTLFWQKD